MAEGTADGAAGEPAPQAVTETSDERVARVMREAAKSHAEMSRIGREKGFLHTDYGLACLDMKMDLLNEKMSEILSQLGTPAAKKK